MKQAHPPAADRPRSAGSASRFLDADPGFARISNEPSTCAVCHWAVLAVRRFKGRPVCLACIAEYFAEDGDDT